MGKEQIVIELPAGPGMDNIEMEAITCSINEDTTLFTRAARLS